MKGLVEQGHPRSSGWQSAESHSLPLNLESGYDIRTVQELLGHNDVKTTMIYTSCSQAWTGRGSQPPSMRFEVVMEGVMRIDINNVRPQN